MTYIKVEWTHDCADDPTVLYCELDDDRMEVRKVEVFRNGNRGYASSGEDGGGTRLGEAPLPPLAEIAEDPQFEPLEISKEEFEELWSKRTI